MGRKKDSKQRRNRFIAGGLGLLSVLIIFGLALSQVSMPVMQPAGPVAAGERQLMVTAFLLMLIVVIPVFILLFLIAWRYRESNTKATYKPNWDHSRAAETVWWLIPSMLIVVLAIITWRGTHAHDPYKPLAVQGNTMRVQVVALEWRWLFIYPDHGVASLNEVRMPVNKSVEFNITADAPMNSFWIPQLGGQIYAMPGMDTRLHLMADRPGSYYGSSANLSGEGFADMNFRAIATSRQDFDDWVQEAKKSPVLTRDTYDKLAKPSTGKAVQTYGKPDSGLYATIINKYMNMDHAAEGHSHMEAR